MILLCHPKEAEITTAIKRIMYQPVTVAVLTNNGERQHLILILCRLSGIMIAPIRGDL